MIYCLFRQTNIESNENGEKKPKPTQPCLLPDEEKL